jgi:hypothetical protein
MSTPNKNGGKVSGEIVVVDVILFDFVPPPGVDVNDTDMWGKPIDTSLYAEIAPQCGDEGTLQALDNWADKVQLYVMYPGVPYPGPNGAWVGLLTNVIPRGTNAAKFPRELGETLKPWIPAALYDTVVAK